MIKGMNKDYMDNANKIIQLLKILKKEFKKYEKLVKRGYVADNNIKIDRLNFDNKDYCLIVGFEYSTVELKLIDESDDVYLVVKRIKNWYPCDENYVEFTVKGLIKSVYNIPYNKNVYNRITRKAFGFLGIIGKYTISH